MAVATKVLALEGEGHLHRSFLKEPRENKEKQWMPRGKDSGRNVTFHLFLTPFGKLLEVLVAARETSL